MDNHILVVEDDAAIREGVRILLEGEGYIVQEAEDGYQCLKKVSDDIDLVILDIMMPGISGIKTCEEIRKISHVPVLFLTAKSQESDKLLGLMAGGDDYLVKPFSYAELLARVKALLRRYHVYSQTLQGEKTKEHWIEYGKTSVYKGYKQDKIEMRGDRAEMSDFPLYLNTVAGGLDRRDQTIGGFSFVVKIYAVPVIEIIG